MRLPAPSWGPCVPGTARARSCSGPQPSWWLGQASRATGGPRLRAGADGGTPRLLRGSRRVARRVARRDPARLQEAGPHLSPRRQQGPGRRSPLPGDRRGLRCAVGSGHATALRRLRPRLPPGTGGHRSGDLGTSASGGLGRWAGPGAGRCRAPGVVHGRVRRPGRRHRRPLRRPLRRPGRLRGGTGTGGAPSGDLYLVVRIAPHSRYRVEGRDLHVDLPLAAWEAALGTSVVVDTPGGEAKVRVPAGTSSGRRLRLRGRGLPNPRGPAGDLFADVRIVVPPSLTERERELFEELARTSTFNPRRRP